MRKYINQKNLRNGQHNKYKEQNQKIKDGFMKYSRENISILPPPAILESYEEISPGIVDKLINMIQEEQQNRNKIEIKKNKALNFNLRIGQFLSIIAIIMLFHYTMEAMKNFGIITGFIFLFSGILFLAFLNISGYKSYRSKKLKFKNKNNNIKR